MIANAHKNECHSCDSCGSCWATASPAILKAGRHASQANPSNTTTKQASNNMHSGLPRRKACFYVNSTGTPRGKKMFSTTYQIFARSGALKSECYVCLKFCPQRRSPWWPGRPCETRMTMVPGFCEPSPTKKKVAWAKPGESAGFCRGTPWKNSRIARTASPKTKKGNGIGPLAWKEPKESTCTSYYIDIYIYTYMTYIYIFNTSIQYYIYTNIYILTHLDPIHAGKRLNGYQLACAVLDFRCRPETSQHCTAAVADHETAAARGETDVPPTGRVSKQIAHTLWQASQTPKNTWRQNIWQSEGGS